MQGRDLVKILVIVAVVIFVYPMLKKLLDGIVGKKYSGLATFLAVVIAIYIFSLVESMV